MCIKTGCSATSTTCKLCLTEYRALHNGDIPLGSVLLECTEAGGLRAVSSWLRVVVTAPMVEHRLVLELMLLRDVVNVAVILQCNSYLHTNIPLRGLVHCRAGVPFFDEPVDKFNARKALLVALEVKCLVTH